MERLKIPVSARKSFNGKFASKMIFQSDILCYFTDTDIGSLKSVHTLFNEYLNHMLARFEEKNAFYDIQLVPIKTLQSLHAKFRILNESFET